MNFLLTISGTGDAPVEIAWIAPEYKRTHWGPADGLYTGGGRENPFPGLAWSASLAYNAGRGLHVIGVPEGVNDGWLDVLRERYAPKLAIWWSAHHANLKAVEGLERFHDRIVGALTTRMFDDANKDNARPLDVSRLVLRSTGMAIGTERTSRFGSVGMRVGERHVDTSLDIPVFSADDPFSGPLHERVNAYFDTQLPALFAEAARAARARLQARMDRLPTLPSIGTE